MMNHSAEETGQQKEQLHGGLRWKGSVREQGGGGEGRWTKFENEGGG